MTDAVKMVLILASFFNAGAAAQTWAGWKLVVGINVFLLLMCILFYAIEKGKEKKEWEAAKHI